MTFLTVGNALKAGQLVVYDYYESEDKPFPNTPPRKLLRHRECHMEFRTERDATAFYDILILAIDRWEIKDKDLK